MSPQVGDIWYRLEDRRYSCGVDEYGESLGGYLKVDIDLYQVIKVTPCGVRLQGGRFVNRNHVSQFACPTIEKAKKSFHARKRKQAAIYKARARRAEEAMQLAQALVKP